MPITVTWTKSTKKSMVLTKPSEECLLSIAMVLENFKGISRHLSLNNI